MWLFFHKILHVLYLTLISARRNMSSRENYEVRTLTFRKKNDKKKPRQMVVKHSNYSFGSIAFRASWIHYYMALWHANFITQIITKNFKNDSAIFVCLKLCIPFKDIGSIHCSIVHFQFYINQRPYIQINMQMWAIVKNV